MIAPRQHAATVLVAPWHVGVQVDNALVPAILALWALGIRTAWSCQGGPAPGARHALRTGYVALCDPDDTPRALEHLRHRAELRCVRVRRLDATERDRLAALRRGDPVHGPARFELADVPGETFDQWHERAMAAARSVGPRYLTPEEAAAELRDLEQAECRPVCIEFAPVGR